MALDVKACVFLALKIVRNFKLKGTMGVHVEHILDEKKKDIEW